MATITTSAHGCEPFAAGDCITITTPDRRWWKRLLHCCLFLDPPLIITLHHVTSVSNSTVEIKS